MSAANRKVMTGTMFCTTAVNKAEVSANPTRNNC